MEVMRFSISSCVPAGFSNFLFQRTITWQQKPQKHSEYSKLFLTRMDKKGRAARCQWGWWLFSQSGCLSSLLRGSPQPCQYAHRGISNGWHECFISALFFAWFHCILHSIWVLFWQIWKTQQLKHTVVADGEHKMRHPCNTHRQIVCLPPELWIWHCREGRHRSYNQLPWC